MGNGRRAHKLLLGKPEGKRSRGRPKMRLEDNITSNLKEIDYENDLENICTQKGDIPCLCLGGNEHSGFIMPVSYRT